MDRRKALIGQALEHLGNPKFPDVKSRRRLEKVLASGQKTGELAVDELGKATLEMLREIDVMRFSPANKDGRTDSDAASSQGLGVLFLLIFLLLLLALLGEDSDVGALIQELIDELLGRG